jgi:hypothetical protein
MIISVINHSKLADTTVLETIRAINRQISEDFEPYWSLGATLRLEGKSHDQPDSRTITDMRGDAVLYLWDEVKSMMRSVTTTGTTGACRTVLSSGNCPIS